MTFKDVLCNAKPLYGKKIGCHRLVEAGLETAEFICARGNEVTVVEMLHLLYESIIHMI